MDHINISKMSGKTRELLREFALIFFSVNFTLLSTLFEENLKTLVLLASNVFYSKNKLPLWCNQKLKKERKKKTVTLIAYGSWFVSFLIS
jgi:predicted ATPase